MYYETEDERARRTDPTQGMKRKRYGRLSYAIAIVVHAMRILPRIVFRSVEAASNPDVARAELADDEVNFPTGPTIAELVADGTLSPPRDVSAECSEAEVAPAKRKRVRVRSKPLTDADVIVGGVYVPKRGNDKTPNFIVESVERTPTDGNWCSYYRTGPRVGDNEDCEISRISDFLALVARRVDA